MKNNKKGFTLLEILIIIAIAAIMAAIAIPNFLSWAPLYRVKGASNRLFSELQVAKMKAIAERTNCIISFDDFAGSYKIYMDDNRNYFNAGIEEAELVKEVVIANDYPGIMLSTEMVGPLVFRPTGLPDQGNVQIILEPEMEGAGNLMRIVDVSMLGRIKISKQ